MKATVFFHLSNESLGCVPTDQTHIYFNRYIINKGYQICNDSFEKYDFTVLSHNCGKVCKSKCNRLSFELKIESTKNVVNETVLEVIPKKYPHIAYIETLKTDFDRLIYNCGGVLGLWFGISPVTAVDLFLYLFRFCKNLIVKGVRFVYSSFKNKNK